MHITVVAYTAGSHAYTIQGTIMTFRLSCFSQEKRQRTNKKKKNYQVAKHNSLLKLVNLH